ncbi:MAG: CinA family protein, partial [Bacteroidaceae bacterium]|nr:CinA family protein [Bacteroidaceae bacterium]
MNQKLQTEKLGDLLRKVKLTISTAESCTAGGVGAAVASVDGASDYYVGGAICYATRLKEELLG